MNRPLYSTSFAVGMICLVVVGVAAPCSADDDPSGTIKLFNGTDLSGWRTYIGPGSDVTDPGEIWQVKDGIIRCRGHVPGYLLTEDEFKDYVLRFQWRWGDEVARGRNSGAFVHVVGEDQIWPKGIEAQLMAGHAGDFWLVGGAKLTVDKERQDPKVERHYLRMPVEGVADEDVEKPIGEWNQYEITCRGDSIELRINGHLVNVGTQSELTKGRILLQSEGGEIHFRNIELTPLD